MGNEGTFESFDAIPYPSWGTYVLSSAIRPDPDAGVYQGFCYGTENSRTLFLVRPFTQKIYINGRANNNEWSGWKER